MKTPAITANSSKSMIMELIEHEKFFIGSVGLNKKIQKLFLIQCGNDRIEKLINRN
jgi:hypothetical protein